MESLELEIGLADSHLESYWRTNGDLVVVVRAWNEKQVRLVFRDVIFVRDRCAAEFADLVTGVEREDEALEAGLACAFEKPPAVHSYAAYAFKNADDVKTLEIVASGHSISYQEGSAKGP